MYKDSKRACTAIVLLIKPFVWWRSRRPRRRGLLKLPSCRRNEGIMVALIVLTAAWLAQLVERQSAVREVDGSSPRPDQHSGS